MTSPIIPEDGRPEPALLRIRKPGRPRWFWLRPDVPSTCLVGGLLLLLGGGALLPGRWVRGRAEARQEAWFHQASGMAERLSQASLATDLALPGSLRWDPEGLRERLASHPLNQALVQEETGAVWLRGPGGFVPAAPSWRTAQMAAWARIAGRRPEEFWPVPRLPAAWGGEEALVMVRDRVRPWIILKAWTPGSREVDAFLEALREGWMPVRFGLLPSRLLKHLDEGASSRVDWAPPGPGADGMQLTWANLAPPYKLILQGTRFHRDGWIVVIAPPREALAVLVRARRGDLWIAWSLYALTGLLGGAVLLGLLSRMQRNAFDAQRMAALAHSLKTPLALMKVRCDTARNESLSLGRREASLLRINDGVDQLLELIENGLEAFRPSRGRLQTPRIAPRFFEDLEEELLPALEEEGRSLFLELEAGPFRAHPGALHAALSILLENALIHGRGAIRLRTLRHRGRVRVSVSDEGPGVPEAELRPLLQRGSRGPVREVPIRPSQGLGLHLLDSLAAREAWGLSFEYGPGFTAVLEWREP